MNPIIDIKPMQVYHINSDYYPYSWYMGNSSKGPRYHLDEFKFLVFAHNNTVMWTIFR
jgi:hypothetical protein